MRSDLDNVATVIHYRSLQVDELYLKSIGNLVITIRIQFIVGVRRYVIVFVSELH